MIHKFNDSQIQNLYNDESLGLTTEKKTNDYLKTNGETGYTLSKINEFLKSLEVNQVLTKEGVIFPLLPKVRWSNSKLI
jgi:hypothetical protein